ncbi:hypothetical protein [Candidatus Hepatoplasma crinochetorum]|jgi:hypothetical protein|uniref:Uncharacterized protein n=1 Tax=Candidatus Hepatoplasma crinochetorum Av TaxID=1427984 RepID=W8GSQ6_9MOLU|nr:hypothetical protein [Candidatus Hepatoplasma crinochetorum]AHK22435.1 hypothetical protein X271_00329 [Candidatus Hepatoplasma crinochetorum Av]BDV03024.1 MAG: hypothetical protein HCTKY_3180 [Candidatus Hepatoplasma crinochetorum]
MNDKNKLIHLKAKEQFLKQKEEEKEISSVLLMKKIDEKDNNNSNNNQGPLFESNNYLIVY